MDLLHWPEATVPRLVLEVAERRGIHRSGEDALAREVERDAAVARTVVSARFVTNWRMTSASTLRIAASSEIFDNPLSGELLAALDVAKRADVVGEEPVLARERPEARALFRPPGRSRESGRSRPGIRA